eukprot:4219696-Lingulodinium_polyedra.AAC.1
MGSCGPVGSPRSPAWRVRYAATASVGFGRSRARISAGPSTSPPTARRARTAFRSGRGDVSGGRQL